MKIRENSIAKRPTFAGGSSNYHPARRCRGGRRQDGLVGHSSRVWLRQERGAHVEAVVKFISPPFLFSSSPSRSAHPSSSRYRGRCDARFPPGKKSIAIRKLAPPNDDIHAPLPSVPPVAEFLGIPRVVTGGGDRVRLAISQAPTPARDILLPPPSPSANTSSRHRGGPETFGGGMRRGREREREGVSSVSSTEAGAPSSRFVPCSPGFVEYLDRSNSGYTAYICACVWARVRVRAPRMFAGDFSRIIEDFALAAERVTRLSRVPRDR